MTGGSVTGSYGLASTEVLTPEASTWKYAGALPKAVYGLREDFLLQLKTELSDLINLKSAKNTFHKNRTKNCLN